MRTIRGTFYFDPPPNIPRGALVIDNAEWRECTKCGERIIPHKLDLALDAEAKKRGRI